MRNMKPILMMLCLGFTVFAAPPVAKADEWNKAVKVTFNSPVEIPRMVLGPGTYVFRLADSVTDRNVVQILNSDETHLYENVLAVPAYRQEATDDVVVTFEERQSGAPQAIEDWFYPGDRYGEEFVYPKVHFTGNAALSPQKTNPTTVTASVATSAKVSPYLPPPQPIAPPAVSTPQPPIPEPVQIVQNTTPSVPTPAPAAASKPSEKPAEKTLPKTGGPVPMLILIGLLSLGTSSGIHWISKNRS